MIPIGISIRKSGSILTVGENASLTCTSDLSISSIEWLHNFQVVNSSSSLPELELNFNPVNDSIHGNEYTCRVTSPYGVQEQTVQLVVQSKYWSRD